MNHILTWTYQRSDLSVLEIIEILRFEYHTVAAIATLLIIFT